LIETAYSVLGCTLFRSFAVTYATLWNGWSSLFGSFAESSSVKVNEPPVEEVIVPDVRTIRSDELPMTNTSGPTTPSSPPLSGMFNAWEFVSATPVVFAQGNVIGDEAMGWVAVSKTSMVTNSVCPCSSEAFAPTPTRFSGVNIFVPL